VDDAVAWNIRALEINEDDLIALTNLGHIYFDLKKWDSAKHYYQKAFSINNRQEDILFRLSLIALMERDLDGCVGHCELLLDKLKRSNNRVIQSIKDVAFIYHEMGEGFKAAGKNELCREAINFARILEAG
jgi:tetratricopeptide (TPR) repeat protein